MKMDKTDSSFTRPPIVTILGHVDHGKTTLLDFIRKTNFAKKEAGGITQGVGASVVETTDGRRITFIDTPGHAAFTKMRSRGVSLADIAILVVAGEEGVKPQTKEALDFILATKIPYIVAVTKVDLPTASVENVRIQLQNLGVSFEGSGGNVSLLGVSAKTGEGVLELLDLIVLTSQVYGLKGSPEELLEAMVIETGKDKRGPTVSVVVKSGSIKVGQNLVSEEAKAKVRGIFDHQGKSVANVLPGEPALLLGFENPPLVGSRIWTGSTKESLSILTERKSIAPAASESKFSLILKTQSAGAIEAITANIPPEITIVSSSVGDVVESDIFLAKSTSSSIFVFEAKVSTSVGKLAVAEGVKIETFDIVYELFERLEKILKSGTVEIKGKAEIVATFPFDGKNVAGCRVIMGKITKTDVVKLTRGAKEVGEIRILTMKKAKEDVQEVKQGEECGIFFTPQLDFKIGDVILSVNKNK